MFTKILLVLSILSILGIKSLQSEIPDIPIEYYFKTNISGFPQMKTYENKLFLLYHLPEDFWVGENNYSLDYYENGHWTNLLGREDSLSIYDFDIDKSGNVWVVSGRGLFKYNWKEWKKYVIDDSLKNFRDFTNICIDSNDYVWCTTFCGIPSKQTSSSISYKATYREIYKFKEGVFKLLKFESGGLINDRFGGKNGIVCLPDGRVMIHYPFYAYNNRQDVKNNLLIYDKDSLKVTTIVGPIHKKVQLPTVVNQIYPDTQGNVWFCLGADYRKYDSGLTMLKNDGSWKPLTQENGFMLWPSEYPDFSEFPYLDTWAIYQDNTGKYWVGGDRFFGYLDNDLKLRIPNNSFYEKCTLIAFDWMNTKQEDSTIKKLFYNLTHYSEIGVPLYWWGRVGKICGNNNGDIWFGTSLGLLHYTPGPTDVNRENINDESFAVYPNPIQNSEKYINLVLYGNNNDLVNVKLYSMTGQLVSESQVSFWGDLGRFPLPQDLTAGHYFVKIQSNNNVYTEKIIIN